MEYVKYGVDAGLAVDEFAPRLSFFFNAHNDFFEEIAKFRAARRVWAKVMRDRYGAKNPESWKLRFHTQTAGVSLTAQQPYNNVARVAVQALAAVLGGTQSLHTNALDETLALPTEFAAKVAVRTQQILMHETGVAHTIDPLGGSYFVEEATNRMEEGAFDYFRRIDAYGGMVEAIEAGFPQKEIMDAAYRFQRGLDAGDKVMVGVNAFTEEVPEDRVKTLEISEQTAAEQVAQLNEVRADARRKGGRLDASRPARGVPERRERHAAPRRGGQGLRDGRRDLGRHARRLRDVGRARGFLTRGSVRPGTGRFPLLASRLLRSAPV